LNTVAVDEATAVLRELTEHRDDLVVMKAPALDRCGVLRAVRSIPAGSAG
jgi:hypothetical protein